MEMIFCFFHLDEDMVPGYNICSVFCYSDITGTVPNSSSETSKYRPNLRSKNCFCCTRPSWWNSGVYLLNLAIQSCDNVIGRVSSKNMTKSFKLFKNHVTFSVRDATNSNRCFHDPHVKWHRKRSVLNKIIIKHQM